MLPVWKMNSVFWVVTEISVHRVTTIDEHEY